MLGSTVLVPFLLVPAMGGTPEDLAQVIQTTFFISGICTLLQTFFGDRLPIVQVTPGFTHRYYRMYPLRIVLKLVRCISELQCMRRVSQPGGTSFLCFVMSLFQSISRSNKKVAIFPSQMYCMDIVTRALHAGYICFRQQGFSAHARCLPEVQGVSFAYLTPCFSIIANIKATGKWNDDPNGVDHERFLVSAFC